MSSGDAEIVTETEVTIENRSGGYRCCSLPYGNLTFAISLPLSLAFCMSLAAHNWCNFVSIDMTVSGNSSGKSAIFNTLGAGLWSYMGNGTCYYYPENFPFDSYFLTARAFAVLAATLGGLVMTYSWFSACVGFPSSVWRTMGLVLLLVCLCEGLTFLIFKSNVLCGEAEFLFVSYSSECGLDWGAQNGIAASVLWFLGALVMLKAPEPLEPEPIKVKEIVTKQETILPDGTKQIVTNTTYERV